MDEVVLWVSFNALTLFWLSDIKDILPIKIYAERKPMVKNEVELAIRFTWKADIKTEAVKWGVDGQTAN